MRRRVAKPHARFAPAHCALTYIVHRYKRPKNKAAAIEGPAVIKVTDKKTAEGVLQADDASARRSSMSDLYETDFVLWAERQADALHRRAANEIDWGECRRGDRDLGQKRSA